jgi:hypothetical protein
VATVPLAAVRQPAAGCSHAVNVFQDWLGTLHRATHHPSHVQCLASLEQWHSSTITFQLLSPGMTAPGTLNPTPKSSLQKNGIATSATKADQFEQPAGSIYHVLLIKQS